jgi:hypothetical protein
MFKIILLIFWTILNSWITLNSPTIDDEQFLSS